MQAQDEVDGELGAIGVPTVPDMVSLGAQNIQQAGQGLAEWKLPSHQANPIALGHLQAGA